MLEDILGVRPRDGELRFKSCLSEDWREVSVTYRRDGKVYDKHYSDPMLADAGQRCA